MFGERAVVDLEPRLLVLSDDERAHGHPVRPRRLGDGREQRPPHLPKHSFTFEAPRPREPGPTVVRAARPQPQPPPGPAVGDERFDQAAAVAVTAMRRMDGELGTRSLD